MVSELRARPSRSVTHFSLSSGFEIVDDTQENFGVELAHGNVSTSCDIVWSSIAKKYIAGCSVPDLQTAGDWAVETSLDSALVHSETVRMQCPKATFETQNHECETCIPGVSCDVPGTKLLDMPLAEGFWRSSATSTKIHKCTFGEHACGGGNGPDYCKPGYVGPLCGTCDERWFLSWADQRCSDCKEAGSHTASIIIGCSLFVLFVAAAGTVYVSRAYEHERIQGCVAKLTRFWCKFECKAFVLFVTAQVLYQYSTVTSSGESGYPEPARSFVNALSFSNLEFLSYVPAECIFLGSTFYTKLVIKTVGPLIVCALLWLPVLCLFVKKLRLKNSRKRDAEAERAVEKELQEYRTSAITYSMLFLELILPSVSTTIAQTFECEELGGKQWLRAQLTLSCQNSGWKAYATFMAVLFPVRRAIRGAN